MTEASKTWFITGTTSGFGRELELAKLHRQANAGLVQDRAAAR